jgi:hypothetical protein
LPFVEEFGTITTALTNYVNLAVVAVNTVVNSVSLKGFLDHDSRPQQSFLLSIIPFLGIFSNAL